MQVPSALLIPTTQILHPYQLKVKASNFDSKGRFLCWLGWSSHSSITSQWLELILFYCKFPFRVLSFELMRSIRRQEGAWQAQIGEEAPKLSCSCSQRCCCATVTKGPGLSARSGETPILLMAPEVSMHSWLALLLWGLWQAAHCGRELLASQWLSINHVNNG